MVKESFDPFGDAGGAFWGGDEVLRWLKRYITVERSGADPSVYLIEPSAEDRLGFGGAQKSSPSSPKLGVKAAGPSAISGPAPSNTSRDAGMDPVTKALKQARWSFLEKMSKFSIRGKLLLEPFPNSYLPFDIPDKDNLLILAMSKAK